MQTTHITLVGDAPKNIMVDLGVQLEKFRDTFKRVSGGHDAELSLPITIYVMRENPALQQGSGNAKRHVAGFFRQHAYRGYIVAYMGSPNANVFHVVYHEYVHFLLAQYPWEVPLWYNEGLAEVLATFRVSNGRIEVGHPLPLRMQSILQHPWFPLEELLVVEPTSSVYRNLAIDFHSQAWALTQYLLLGSKDRYSQLKKFLWLIQQGKSVDAAFYEAFDVTYKQLREEVIEYFSSANIVVGSFPDTYHNVDIPYNARSLSPEETLDHVRVLQDMQRMLSSTGL